MIRFGFWLSATLLSASLLAQSSTHYVRLPLVFEANLGQADARVRFLARGAGYGLYLTPDEAILTLRGERDPLRLKLDGGRRGARVVARQPLPGKSNYLFGQNPKNWITDVPQYARVEIEGVYPGIDLVYHGDNESGGRLEYDFVVAPGADPALIALTFDGGARIDKHSGDLLLASASSTIRQLRPRVYQDIDGQRREISGRYVLTAQHTVRFALGRYDRRHELVIDPVFLYGAVLPGSGVETGLAVAADSSGNAYVTGYTTSTDFLLASPLQNQPLGGKEVFVSKVNAAGTALVYSTYLGGSSDEEAHGIAVDAAGNAYIAGWTESFDFPTHLPLQGALLGTRNAFVAELNATGSALVYSTYLGGSASDQANAIAVDGSGRAVVTGATTSANFPTVSALRGALSGTANAFVSKIQPGGTGLVYSTYLGGSGSDTGNAIALGSSGDAYIAGSTTSADFPLVNERQSIYAGSGDVFLTRINAAGSSILSSTYYGGAGQDDAYGVALDPSGNVFVSGFSTSIATFPAVNALPPPPLAASGFLFKLNSGLTAVLLSTILSDNGRGVVTDSYGNAYVAYLSRINADGSGIDYSLPVSGTIPRAIAIDPAGNVFITGQGATLVSPPLATPKDFADVSMIKIGEPGALRIGYVQPSTAWAGSAGTSVTVYGAGFVNGAAVQWNGSPRSTMFVSATQLKAALTAPDFAAAGVDALTVVNPSSATSSPAVFTVKNQPPTITSLSPASGTTGGAAFTLTVNGANFIAGSSVYWNGAARTTTVVSPAQVTALIPASDIAAAGPSAVQVLVPTPGGGLSPALSFAINNPAPAISSLSPGSVSTGGADFTLTVQGTGFTASSVVNWNGSARATTYVSKVQLRATITASDVATAGTFAVTVFNPAPGGGTSPAVTYAVSGVPAPAIASLSPVSALAGGGTFTLNITGTGFIGTSQVQWNGLVRSTTYVSSTQLTATITAQDIAAAATASVTVANLVTSPAVTFAVNNPLPTLASMLPATMATASPAFTLTLNGTGFVATSQVRWNGSNRATTFINATQLTAAIASTDVATAGVAQVTVLNTSPGGGSSDAAIFTIASNPVPTLASLSPTSQSVNSAFTLTVTGAGFVAGSQVLWNGVGRATTYLNNTQLTAAILAADLPATGGANVTVFNPAPGGGTSSSLAFSITQNPAPTLLSISPSTVLAGSGPTIIRFTGSGFAPNAQARLNGAYCPTGNTGSTLLTASLPASDFITAGTATMTVSNALVGGGDSNGLTLTVANPVPVVNSISPTSAPADGASFTLTVNGSSFFPTSQVQWAGSNRVTAYIGATQLSAVIPASDLAAGGNVLVTVFNPSPGGGAAAGVTFTVNNPAPVIGSLLPRSVMAASGSLTLTVNGSGFFASSAGSAGSIVQWNGSNRATTFVSSTQLTASLAAADVASAGTASVTVLNSAPGGGTSVAAQFTVQAQDNPVPAITTISPTTASVSAGALTLTVNGSGFSATSQVKWNGSARVTTFVSAQQLTASLVGNDLSVVGAGSVTVVNPAPGGGTSGPMPFTITANPAAAIASITPSSASTGSGAITLTITGSGFVAASIVQWNGGNRETTFIGATQLSVAILAADLASAGPAAVTVVNPAPGGGTSQAVSFAVNNPVPSLWSLSPAAAVAGSGGFTLMLSGAGFIAGSQVLWNGAILVTTYVSSTQLSASVPAGNVSFAASPVITVVNAEPGGGTSLGKAFTITGNPMPMLAGLIPATAPVASGSFTLAVFGTGFTPSSTVQFNGQTRVTIYVSTTEVTAAILASDILAIGPVSVTVTNPAPGGGVSNPPDIFTVTGAANPAPAITTLSPPSAAANGGALTLTLTGSGFIPTSQVQWNGVNRATTYLSSTQLTAAIPAADLVSAGSGSVTVVNGLPGGGTSNTMPFAVTLVCAFTLAPSATMFEATASTGTIGISAAPGCAWSAASLDAFLTITSNPAGSGTGSVAFSMTANPSSARSGRLVVAGQNVTLTQDGTMQGVVAVAPIPAAPGTTVRIPVTLAANSGMSVDKLAFSVQITPNGPAPALTGALAFSPDAALGAASNVDTSGGAGLISVSWLSLSIPIGGTKHVGDVILNLPATGLPGQTYATSITGASGSYQASSVALARGSDSTVTLALDYLVGDTFPVTADNAGKFGDGIINTVDLIYALRAVTAVPGYVPASCSDRFDALDAFPADTATTRGGDSVLNTLDLLAILQRVTGVNNERPRRVARGLPCSQTSAQARKPERPYDGSLELGAGGEVYLVAVHDLILDGLAISISSSDGAALQWSGVEPGLKDRGLSGVLTLAFLDRLQIGAGERLLLGQVVLGQVRGGTDLRLSGVSAHSGPDDIRLRVPTVRPQSAGSPR